MSEIHMVEVYGITVKSDCAELLKIVINFGGSDSAQQRLQANEALEKMGNRGCVGALQYVVQKFSGCDSAHQRNLANRALELM